MNFLSAPPERPNDGFPDGGPVDQLLRAFYRSEMPNPWPPLALPAHGSPLSFPTPSARRPLSARSRLALAASIALLIGGLWSLSGMFGALPRQEPGFRASGGTAEKAPPGMGQPTSDLNSFKEMKPVGDGSR